MLVLYTIQLRKNLEHLIAKRESIMIFKDGESIERLQDRDRELTLNGAYTFVQSRVNFGLRKRRQSVVMLADAVQPATPL